MWNWTPGSFQKKTNLTIPLNTGDRSFQKIYATFDSRFGRRIFSGELLLENLPDN